MSLKDVLASLVAAHRAVGSPVPDFLNGPRSDAGSVLQAHRLGHVSLVELYEWADGLDADSWDQAHRGPAFLFPHVQFRSLDRMLEEREDWSESPWMSRAMVPLFTDSGSGYIFDARDGSVRDLSVDQGHEGYARADSMEAFIRALTRRFEDGSFYWDAREGRLQIDVTRERPLMA